MWVATSYSVTYAEKERGGKGRASVRPGALSCLQGEGMAPTRFKGTSCETLTSGIDGWKVMSLSPAPGGAAPSISAGAFPASAYAPPFSRSVLACFEIQKVILPRHLSLLANAHTHTNPQAPPCHMNYNILS